MDALLQCNRAFVLSCDLASLRYPSFVLYRIRTSPSLDLSVLRTGTASQSLVRLVRQHHTAHLHACATMTDDGGIAAESANESSSQLSRDTLTTCPGPACESADGSSLLLRDTLTTCPSPACVAFGTTRVWCNRAWSWGHEETARFVNAWHGAQPATEVVVAVPHDKCDPRGPSQDVTNDTASIGVGNHRRYRLTGGDVDGACVLYADELPLLDNTDDDRRDDSAHSSRDSADGNNGDGDRKRFDFLFEHLVGPDALVVFQARDVQRAAAAAVVAVVDPSSLVGS